MKYRLSHWSMKFLAWLLAALCLVFGVWSAYIVLTCANFGLYGEQRSYQQTSWCRERVLATANEVIAQYRRDPDYQGWDKLLKDTQLRFVILEEETGKVTASYVEGMNVRVPGSLKDNAYLRETNYVMERGTPGTIFETVYVIDYYFNDNWDGEQYYWYEEQLVSYPVVVLPEENKAPIDSDGVMHQMLCLLPLGLQVDDSPVGEGFELYIIWNHWKEDAAVILLLCVLGLLLSMVFLCCQAGRRPGKEQVVTTWFDRLWLEAALAIGALAIGAQNAKSDISFCVMRALQLAHWLCWDVFSL